MSRPLEIVRLGRIRYSDGLERMEAQVDLRRKGEAPDTLFLLEHDPVLTLGRRGSLEHVLASREALAARGVDLVHTGRGGDVTYHGPGQVVGYPVLDLNPERRDVRRYVHDLEEVMVRVCATYGVRAGRMDGLIGAWVDGRRKIGAIGVRISRWITSHGFALNVAVDLGAFDLIVPCGIREYAVTSLAIETGLQPTTEGVMDRLETCFRGVFGGRQD